MIIILTLSMTGSILPYRGGLRDSKVIATFKNQQDLIIADDKRTCFVA
jgi:hypothetical protein